MSIFIIIVLVYFFLILLIHALPTKRKRVIKEIISDLESLPPDPKYDWSRKENIKFFQASRSVFTYILWLIKDVPQLRKKKDNLIELADLPLPKWQKETHRNLIKLERLSFPDLLGMIRKKIISEIETLSNDKRTIVLMSIGSGAMELERQIIEELYKVGFKQSIIFLGIDQSENILGLSEGNLSELIKEKKIHFKKMNHISQESIDKLKEGAGDNQYTVVLVNEDATEMDNSLDEDVIDLIYHSRLKHHLSLNNRKKLDDNLMFLAKKVIEMDDICSIPIFIFPSIITWYSPTTLNGAILSYIRDPSKKELSMEKDKRWQIKIHNFLGYYLKIYDESKTE